MNDAEISQILPEWASWSKSQRDEVFRDYQLFVFQGTADFRMIEKRSEILEKERFLKLLPKKIEERDGLSLFQLMDDNWAPIFHNGNNDESKQLSLALEVWDHANAAIVDALDARDGMLALQLIEIIQELARRSGRAVSRLRKSPKFVPWLVFALEEGVPIIDAVPIQHNVYKIINLVALGASKSFFDLLMEHKIPTILFRKLRNCCPSLINALVTALESCVETASQHDKDNANVKVVFEVGNRIACQRILETDMTKQRFRYRTNAEGWTDIGDVAGPLACLVTSLSLYLRITTPREVRNHLGIFGANYRAQPPTDPIEQQRWNMQYFCLRAKQVDWSTDAGQREGSEMLMANKMKSSMVEQERNVTLRCAACHKLDLDDDEELLLSKCGRCKRIYYCSRGCQVSHWKMHKPTCRKPDRSSLPERLLSLSECIQQSHRKATAGGKSFYPVTFAVWLEWKHCSSSNT